MVSLFFTFFLYLSYFLCVFLLFCFYDFSLFDSFFFSLVLLFLTSSFTFAFPPFFVRHLKKKLIRLRKIKVFVLFQRVYRYLLFRVNNADWRLTTLHVIAHYHLIMPHIRALFIKEWTDSLCLKESHTLECLKPSAFLQGHPLTS